MDQMDEARTGALGVFAVICSATGDVWVGVAQGLDGQHDRLWSALRRGAGADSTLQALWTAHGEDAFRFEELERLRDDYPVAGAADELNKRATLWRARLGATALA